MSNTITEVTPKLLAQGLLALRERAVMARLVNRDFGTAAAQRGNTIDIPIASAITTRNVTPAVTQAANQDQTQTSVSISLDQWKEASFQMSDNDQLSVMDGVIPMTAMEAIKSLANTVDSYILGKYTGVYGAVGTAGTTPFATTIGVAGDARKLLFDQLAPVEDRRYVLDTGAENNALQLSNIIEAQKRGGDEGIIQGRIGHILGADWYMDQNVPTHTPGVAWATGWTISTGSATAGDSTLNVINATATSTVLVGDIFTIAGDSQTYAITAALASVSATAVTTFLITPSLVTSYATDAALTVIGNHVVNLAFHRDALAFASRPLMSVDAMGNIIQQATDPVSGLSLRLEVSRQYKQTTWAYDILYGGALIRAPLAVRLMG